MRTYDLSIMQGASALGDVRIALSFGDQGALVTGVQKAAQFFTLAFLTEKGTVLGDAAFGTDFMTNARMGVIRTDDDVPAYFNIAARDILDYQSDNLLAGTPDDEVLDTIELVSYTLEDLRLWMKVRLTTLAGTAREVILPITASPQ